MTSPSFVFNTILFWQSWIAIIPARTVGVASYIKIKKLERYIAYTHSINLHDAGQWS